MENIETYKCAKCNHEIPITNKVLHELRCPGPSQKEENIVNKNNVNLENEKKKNEPEKEKNEPEKKLIKKEEEVKFIPEPSELFTCSECHQTMLLKEKEDHMLSHALQNEEYEQNNEERKREEQRLRDRHEERRNGRRVVRESNGYTRESFEEDLGNGMIRVSNILRDPNGNVISHQSSVLQMNRNNNNNNNNYNNNRRLYDDDNNNNIGRHQITRDNYGNNIETITRQLPNGSISKKTIVKDINGNIISQQEQIISNNSNIIMNSNNNRRNMNNNNMDMDMNMNNMNMNNMNRNINEMMSNMMRQMNMIPRLNMRNGLMSSFNDFNEIENMFNNNPFFNAMRMSNFMGMNMNNPNVSPVQRNVLESLPEITLDDISKLDGEKKNCVICLNDFKVGDKVMILPCVHIFHSQCIRDWFGSKDTCPICKFKLTPENINRNFE